MARKTRIDLKSFVRTKIVEGQISEEITPEMHNQANDEMIDSLLNAIDDLATHSDFLSVDSTAKKYLNPYVASVYFLATGDKATQDQVLAGTVNNKYITPKSLSAALNSNFGLKDHHTDILYSEGSGVFYDNGSGISIWRANKPTSGAFAIDDWDEVATGGGGSISDLSGIPTSTATVSTPTFFNASKNLISATAGLLGTFYDTFASKSTPVDADTIHIGNSASSFEKVKTTLSELWLNWLKQKTDAQYAKKESITINPESAYLATSTSAIIGYSLLGNVNYILFNSTNYDARFRRNMSSSYNNYTVNVLITYCCTTNSGNIKWDVSFDRRVAGVLATSESYSSVKSVTSTVPATAYEIKTETISFSYSEIDGIQANELFNLKVSRDNAVGGNSGGTGLIINILITFS